MKSKLNSLPAKKSFHFLFWGGVNTLFGYGVSVGIYYLLNKVLPLFFILVLINIVSITFSFLTYRYFVFKSQGIWWQEYLKCYVVYGGSAVIGTIGMFILVDKLSIPFWLAQGMLMGISILCSYFGHDKFTFKRV